MPARKVSLQELNQLIGINMPTLVFSRNTWFLIPIPKGQMPVLPTDVHAIINYFISGSTNKASSSNDMKKRF